MLMSHLVMLISHPCSQEKSRRNRQKSYPMEDLDIDDTPEVPLGARPEYVCLGCLGCTFVQLVVSASWQPVPTVDAWAWVVACFFVTRPVVFREEGIDSDTVGDAIMAWDFIKTFSEEGMSIGQAVEGEEGHAGSGDRLYRVCFLC